MTSCCCDCVLVCREMERREKVDEARRETDRILAEQEAEVQARKVCGYPFFNKHAAGHMCPTASVIVRRIGFWSLH